MNNKGFSFVEMLVVVTIIALLTGGAAVTYSATTTRSRDARRKSDVQSIRSALELCRSQTGSYPTIASGCMSGTISCGGATYLNPIPLDPQSPTKCYSYSGTTTTYSITTQLENGGSTTYNQP